MADTILYWNDVALDANRVSQTNGKMEQTGPALGSRALAIVHLAMYDAYAAINAAAGPPYMPGLPAPGVGATTDGAVAGAAHATLSALFPSQRTDFDSKLAAAGGTLTPGYDFGVKVAKALLQDRANDPGAGDSGHVPSFAPGHHRPDPDNPTQGYYAPFYGAKSKCFAVTARHGLLPPPALSTPAYLTALRQVRGHGIAPDLMGTLPATVPGRTTDETLIGLFWAYDGAAWLGTPPRLYNQIIRRIAIARPNTEAQNARLFALVNTAMADAGILAWEQKYIHDVWRPVLGIREYDSSMGLATHAKNDISDDCDPTWLPLGAPASNSLLQIFLPQTVPTFPSNQNVPGRVKNFTPNFPAYPSGHATFGAAAFHIARLFYKVASGDRHSDTLVDGLDFVSDELNGVTQDNRGTIRPRHVRNFSGGTPPVAPTGLWRMILENARSRIFLGVHWSFDAFAVHNNGSPDLTQNMGGVRLGLTIAEDIFNTGMDKSTVGPQP